MSRIFLSHASADNRAAVALKTWLAEQRPELASEIFLDIDPRSGLQVGARWKSQLFDSTSRCEAVICLLSGSWQASHECRTEYRNAEGWGKQILVARLEDTGDSDITAEWQRCDLFAKGPQTEIGVAGGAPVRLNTAALYQLRKAIEGSGVSPHNFVWPPKEDPDRVPYRGWEPFEAIDAGVFFGRDAAIVGGLDELRGMRFRMLATLSKPKSLFVVLGPSGSGKSSFLRAGLIPRLQREDRRFVVLGVLRPEREALTGVHGLAAAIEAGRRAVGLHGPALGEIKAALGDPDMVAGLLAEVRTTAAQRLADAGHRGGADGGSGGAGSVGDEGEREDAGVPTLVLPLDQAEELFAADAGAQAEQFLTLLASLVARLNTADIGLIVAATIRTDRFELLQNHRALDGAGTVLFDDLKPMPATHFQNVITGPAARSTEGGDRLEVAPDLVAALLADATEGADTLPLLALTLARLYGDYASTGQLTLADYQAMGGMGSVVASTIDDVLAADAARRAEQLALLRAAFIPWLATINPDNDQPLRRTARYNDLPEDSRPLIDALVKKRLLVQDTRDGHTVIEVALESLLRQWDELAGWLRAERHNLKTAEDIERSATAWAGHERDPAWLLAGTRLTDAETLANTPGFSDRLAAARDFLAAARDAENQRLAAEERQRHAELRFAQERQHTAEAHAADQRRRARILRAVLVGTAVIAVIAVIGGVVAVVDSVKASDAQRRAEASTRQAIALRLVSDAADLMAGTRSGGDAQAFQELLAAQTLAGPVAGAGILDAAIARTTTAKIIDTGADVNGVAVSPDGHRLASAGADNTVRIWESDTGQPIGAPLIGHTGQVSSVAFSPDGHRLASGSFDHTVRIWNADTGQPIGAPLTGHTDHVSSVAFSPDGHRLASASFDHTVRLWNADTGQQIFAPLTGHTDPVTGVAFSPDGHRLVSASYDATVRIWNADTGQQIGAPLTGHTDPVTGVAFSPDGHHVVSGSDDNTLRLWNIDTGQQIGAPLTGHTEQVFSVAFSPDGHHVVSGSRDRTVRLWNADTGQQIGAPLTGHTDPVTGVAFSPDGHQLVSGSDDHTVRWWNIDAGAPLTGPTEVTSVAFSPDGHRLAGGGGDGTVQIWNVDIGQHIGAPLTGHSQDVNSVAFSPNGHRLASASFDHTVRLWNADTGQQIGAPLTGHTDPVTGVAFSPDGHRLASASYDATVRLWNADTGQQIGRPLTGRSDALTSVAFSPDGQRVAAGELNGGLVWLWNADTAQLIGQPLTGHTATVSSVAFSPNGQRLASASGDKTVRIWNPDTGRTVATLNHPAAVNTVAFAPDGQRLATGSIDGTVRLWSFNGDDVAPFGAPMTAVTTNSDPAAVTSVAFSPDGQRLAAGYEDDTIHLWPAVATPAVLCTKLTINMSRKQWHDWIGSDHGYQTQCPGLPIASDDGQPPPLPGQTQLPFTGLKHPQAITVDHAGTLYVADTGNNRVVKLGAGSTQVTSLPFSGLNAPDGVAVDTAGDLYVADSGNNRVVTLPAGSDARPRTLLDGLNQPSDVAIDSAGTVYVADEGNKRVLELPAGATHPTPIWQSGDSGQPNALAVDTKHTVYLAVNEGQKPDKVLALPPGAAAGTEVPFTSLSAIGGVAVDATGDLFVTGASANSVLERPAGWSVPTVLPFNGLNQPGPVTVDDKGNLYVADTGNNRVLMRHLG